MKRVGKPQNGIKVYKSDRKNSGGTGIQKLLLTAVHIAAVWFVMTAWWEIVVSVFPSPVKNGMLYAAFLFFAVFSAAVFRMRKKWMCVILYLISVACLLWLGRKLIPNILNYLTDSYIIRQIPDMEMPKRGAEELYNSIGMSTVPIYHVEMVAEWQVAAILGLFTAPLFLVLSAVLYCRKGKWLSLLLMFLPFIFVLAVGYVPSLLSGWMLVLSGSFYYAVCGCESGKGACIRGMAAVICLGITAVVLTAVSIPIENQKTVEEGIYRKTHDFIKKDIIMEIKGKVTGTDKKENTKAEPTKKNQEGDKEKEFQDTKDYEPNELFSEDSIKNLKDLSRYQPNYGKLTSITISKEYKPARTVYYPLFYGRSYKDGSWERVELGNEEPEDYCESYIYLNRLTELCEPYVWKPVSEISDFISREFEKNTVYDYNPGATPDDEDFAEYFLFENKKGFCVHFATTATLMYRICGYPARYVQGYAVPADKFVRQEDGSYTAEIDGTMGHAWCEVYDENEWVIKEHTLAYTGEDPYEASPVVDSDMEKQYELKEHRRYLMPLTVLAVILIIINLHVIRIMIIREKRKKSFRLVNKGILNVYKSIYEIGVFFGEKKDNPLSSEGYESMKKIFPKKWESELEWLYWISMEIMFHDKISDRAERKKAAEFYSRLSEEMLYKTKGWQRFRYCYLKCF